MEAMRWRMRPMESWMEARSSGMERSRVERRALRAAGSATGWRVVWW